MAAAAEAADDDDMQVAEAGAVLPPRPDAIITMLTTDDFMPGAQTLLYSVKVRVHFISLSFFMVLRSSHSCFCIVQKALPSTLSYPPELVVLVTPNVSQATRQALYPAFCTRILQVEPIAFPQSSKPTISSHFESGELTKLHIFQLEVYHTLLYIDADCLVVKDVSHLLELGKVHTESVALIAAAPDIFPPDKFNAGVMVVRPSQSVFDNMMAEASVLTSYDGGDTGFLNAYFSEWYTDMPSTAKLSFGYNAQRFLYHCTHEKQPNYWDMAVDLHVIHFSSSPKPWATIGRLKQEAQEHLGEQGEEMLRKTAKFAELETLWRKWYRLAGTFGERRAKEKVKEERQATSAAARQEPAMNNPKDLQKLFTKRYRQLRREGKPAAEAMAMARSQYGLDATDDTPAATQVATMFGMM
jgi:glycogenin glucosyltransferase